MKMGKFQFPSFKNLFPPSWFQINLGESNWWSVRTRREKVLLAILAASVSITSLYILVLEGQMDQFAVLSNEIPLSKQKLDSAKRRIERLPQIEQELVNSRTRYNHQFHAYPSELTTGEMALLVGEAAKASNVTIKYFVPLPKLDRPDREGKLISEIPVNMVVEGAFDALVDFSSRVETLRGGALVRNFAITWENREKEKENQSKAKGNDAKKDSVNVLLELIDVVITTFSKSPSGEVNVQQKSVGNVTIRLPRAEAPADPNVKPKTTMLNAAFTVSFFEVGAGGNSDTINLEQYPLGRQNPFEPRVWDDTNPWLREVGQLPDSVLKNGGTSQGIPWSPPSNVAPGAAPTLPGASGLPTIPVLPGIPSIPGLPSLPGLTPNPSADPMAPSIPTIPRLPSIPPKAGDSART
ncbi:type 4a pilus biogenesis protein PilO [Heliobacterium undosum]|uniref:Type 4a pilus biogenesis protein PilO n=1 Tax=Heliomicrobium undosum TaxID=121734 RepID=A0A845L400_9FIRM|nr:type 4a pilus biogenesis protein PilO [Heliomicrobium undosum]MZP28488.1 type 4a pilus biogenesis protein PilO [Heliomicrobium undosum]